MQMVVESDKDRIRDLLGAIEAHHGVQVLMAVESGSRAWGFASPDSDFDVRFVYQEPLDRMLRLFPGSDVIAEVATRDPDGSGVPVDLVGWSHAKTLRLAVASNPQLCEWARGMIAYRVDPDFIEDLRSLTAQASPRVLAHHYRGLAKRTALDYLAGPEEPISKKYLYACRSVLASSWMIDHPEPGSAPPVPFEALRAQTRVPAAVDNEIDRLLDWKMARCEGAARRRFPVLDRWINSEIERLQVAVSALPDTNVDRDLAERILCARILPGSGSPSGFSRLEYRLAQPRDCDPEPGQ